MAMNEKTILVKPLLEKAATDRKALVSSADAMKLAVFRYIADSLGVKDAKVRLEAWNSFNDKTPGWFGTNASAGQAAMGLKGNSAVKSLEAFDV